MGECRLLSRLLPDADSTNSPRTGRDPFQPLTSGSLAAMQWCAIVSAALIVG